MKLTCSYLDSCPGCPLGTFGLEQQKAIKIKTFRDRIENGLTPSTRSAAEFDFLFPVFDRYRTRCDFVYFDGHLGWFDKEKKFLSIEDCSLQIQELTELARTVAAVQWPVKKGSMRFRIDIEGRRGVWMDLANLDIKHILSSSDLLDPLFNSGIAVEMGQKGKRVVRADEAGRGFKLADPAPMPWFKTVFENKTVPLLALISSFTQTNPDLNVQMIGILKSFLDRGEGDKKFFEVVEFGSGVGNFTLFLSELAQNMSVIENDFRNLIPLRANFETYGLTKKVKVFESVTRFLSEQAPATSTSRLYFVNPARSGVGPLFDMGVQADQVIYVSCHMDSFMYDVAKLERNGFKLKNAVLFDQFPHSKHFEILSYFCRH